MYTDYFDKLCTINKKTTPLLPNIDDDIWRIVTE